MKKLTALILLLVLLASCAAVHAEGIEMRVTNCREWVSLRQKQDTSSRRLAKVPLGDVVTDCVADDFGFIRCTWQGQTGYILQQYLEPAGEGFDLDNMTVLSALELGREVVDFSDGQYRVIVRLVPTEAGETLCAFVFREGGYGLISRLTATDSSFSQVSCLDAFIGGTEQERLLIWFTGESLEAYRIGPNLAQNRVWQLDLSNGGISHGVDEDGTIYLIGYFSDSLTRISPKGKVVWRAKHLNDPDTYWPYRVDVREDGSVDVTYEQGSGGDGAVLTYSKKDGSILGRRPANERPAESRALRVSELPDASGTFFVYDADPEGTTIPLLFCAAEDVTGVRLLDLSFVGFEGDLEVYEGSAVYEVPVLSAGETFSAKLAFNGDIPNNGFAFIGPDGAEHTFAVGLSGEDGSVLFWECLVR